MNDMELKPANDAGIVEEERSIEVVTAEIVTISRQVGQIMLQGAIAIGQRLCEAKELVPHGEWGAYLTERVNLSTSGANNFMRIYREYGDQQMSLFDVGGAAKSQTFGNLSYTKALALLAIPEGERADFVQEHDVEEMSTRELQAAIKERDEARREAEEAKAEREHMEAEKAKLQQDMDFANERVAGLTAELEELRSKPTDVAIEKVVDKQAVAEAKKKGREAAEKELKAEIEKAKLEAEEARKKLVEVEEKAKAQASDAKVARAQATAAKEEAEKLRKELAASGNKTVTAFGVHFARVQEDMSKLLDCLDELDRTGDTENKEKLTKAFRALLEKFGGAV